MAIAEIGGEAQGRAGADLRTTESRADRRRALRVSLAVYEHTACLAVASILAASGILHLENPYYLLSSIYSYDITGRTVGQAVAMTLPCAQLLIAACLLGRVCVEGALLFGTVLCGLFAAAQLTGMWRELHIDCGCFGSAYTQALGARSLSIAVGLFIVAITAYLARKLASFGAYTPR